MGDVVGRKAGLNAKSGEIVRERRSFPRGAAAAAAVT